MGFCYPGKGKSGDLPPRPECRQTWHPRLLPLLDEVRLTVLIGQYAQAYFLGARRRGTLTETVHACRGYAPEYFPFPPPSPRTTGWFQATPWLQDEGLRSEERRGGTDCLSTCSSRWSRAHLQKKKKGP